MNSFYFILFFIAATSKILNKVLETRRGLRKTVNMLTADVPTKENVTRQHQALGTPSKKKTAAAAAADAARGANLHKNLDSAGSATATTPAGSEDASKGIDICYGVLTVISKKTRRCGSRFPITAPVVTIGSDYQCDVRIQNDIVDALHTKIHVDSKGNLWVTNLSKRIVTRLNGDAVREPRMIKRHPTMPDIVEVADRSFYISYPEATDARPKAPPSETPLKKVRAPAVVPVTPLDEVVDNISAMLPLRTPSGRRSAAPSRLAAGRTAPQTPAAVQQEETAPLPPTDDLMDLETPEQEMAPIQTPAGTNAVASAGASSSPLVENGATEAAKASDATSLTVAANPAPSATESESGPQAEFRQVEIEDDPEKRTSVPYHRSHGRRLSVVSFKQRVSSDGEVEGSTESASEVALQRRMATPMRHSIATAAANRVRPALRRMETPMKRAVASRAAMLPPVRPEKRLETPVRAEIARRAEARPNLKPVLVMNAEMKGQIAEAVSKRPPPAGSRRLETPVRGEIAKRASSRRAVLPTKVMDAAVQTEIREKAKTHIEKTTKRRMATPVRQSIVTGASRMVDSAKATEWKRLRSNEIAAEVRQMMATRASAATTVQTIAAEADKVGPVPEVRESMDKLQNAVDEVAEMEMEVETEINPAEDTGIPADAVPRRFGGSRTPGPTSRTRVGSQKRDNRARSLTGILSEPARPLVAGPEPTAVAVTAPTSASLPRPRLETPLREQIMASAERRLARRVTQRMDSPARRAIASLAAEMYKRRSGRITVSPSARARGAVSPKQALAPADVAATVTVAFVAEEAPTTAASPQSAASPTPVRVSPKPTPTKPSRKSLRFAAPAVHASPVASPAAPRPSRARKSVAPSMVRSADIETVASLRNKRKSMAPALAAKSMPSSKRTRKSIAATAQPEEPAQARADESDDVLDSLRVVDLRERLQQRGMLTTGTKSALVARLREAENESSATASTIEPPIAAVEVDSDRRVARNDVGALEDLKVADLRQMLRERGLPTTGKKTDLVERLLSGISAEADATMPTEEPTVEESLEATAMESTPTASELSRLKVAELKAMAESLGLATTGTKAVLTERILQAQTSAQPQPSLDAAEEVEADRAGDDEADYGRMKVAELRAELARLNLDSAGTKAVLVQRLQAVRAAATAAPATEHWSKMKVSELRMELERRKMDASGTKAALVQRLQNL
jgi:hypothetical protein